MLALESVTAAQFEPCLRQTFRLVFSDGSFPLELAQVCPLPRAAGVGNREPFALTFKAAQPIRLPQGIYRLENDQLGLLEVFLVQVSPAEVEAVFN
jgi:hypothetical protein